MTTKRRILLDASALKESSCMRRMKYLVLDGLHRDQLTYKMDYGTAFHKFLQLWMDNGDTPAAMQAAVDYYSTVYVPNTDWRTVSNLCATMEAYVKNYSPDSFIIGRSLDQNALVEQKFCIPLFNTPEVEILAAGTQDALGRYNGEIVHCDHKTTSAAKLDKGVEQAMDRYLNNYNLSTQMLFYRWVNNYLAKVYPSTYGIMANASCMVNVIFLNKQAKPTFKRKVFEFSAYTLASFEKVLFRFCARLAQAVIDNDWEDNGLLNDSCKGDSLFGRCQYAAICERPDNLSESDLVDTLYQKREYNPLKFHE